MQVRPGSSSGGPTQLILRFLQKTQATVSLLGTCSCGTDVERGGSGSVENIGFIGFHEGPTRG